MNFRDFHTTTPVFSYRFGEDNIHEYVFQAVTPLEVDTWASITEAIKPFVVKHHLHVRSLYHMQGVWPTPYAIRKAAHTIGQLPKTLPTSTALLLDDSNVAVAIVQMFLRQRPIRALQSRQIFFQESDALAWLEKRRITIEEQGFYDLPRPSYT